MNAVKTKFSIKDLESLGGIKAHTIRIWEKRYNLFEPDRTPTNIRTYDLKDLQKLLNVTFLLEHNHKISKIAKHSAEEISRLVAEIVAERKLDSGNHIINSFKIAMMNFDQRLFARTFESLQLKLSFRDIFFQVFIPLLEEIGLLWQAGVINPAHEHFITSLIKQKVLLRIEEHHQTNETTKPKTFVLFLPENEIHDLGLMFLNYEITSHGYKCIYLGQSIQTESLKYFVTNQGNIHFVSYFTVKPDSQTVAEYVQDFNTEMESDSVPFYILGRLAQKARQEEMPSNVKLFKSMESFTEML